MSRRRWVGAAAIAFGILMFVGIVISGSTPDRDASDAAQKYAEYWQDGAHQDNASRGALLLMYAFALQVCLAAGLRHLLRQTGDDGPLPTLVAAAGSASAALFAAGGMLINGVGLAGAEGGYTPDGDAAMLTESIGYYTVTAAMLLAGVMVLATSISNRRARVLPQWTIALSVLVGIAGAGTIFTAWLGFMLLPLWAVVVGIVLLVVRPAGEDGTSSGLA
ncbi:MAG TPA: hypothetical protein VNA12_06935 [Mycobacteriales bacterium]|nr:hypothetical protein [Mycobacteriales bacterium]